MEEFFDFTFDDIKKIHVDNFCQRDQMVSSNFLAYKENFLYKKQEIDESLLGESFPPIEEIPDKFTDLVFDNNSRYYVEDLTLRNYLLENTTPYKIEIFNNVIEESSWGNLLCKISILLLTLYPDKRENICEFKCNWTKSVMFSQSMKTNFKSIFKGLYINCNHTAVHACWFLQDILDFFEIDKSKVLFIIHRPCGSEDTEIKQILKNFFIRGFAYYLITNKNKTLEKAKKIINVIGKHLNPILAGLSKSYNDLFLLNNNMIVINYTKKVRDKLSTISSYSDDNKRILNKYLDYLVAYYKI